MLGTVPLAVIARMTRSAMLEVLGEDYIRTARAKGLSTFPRHCHSRAAQRAHSQSSPSSACRSDVLFTGAILTETIFSWPGVGKWLIEGIARRDYPVLQGGTLMIGAIVMIGQSVGRRDLRLHQSPHPAYHDEHRSRRPAPKPSRGAPSRRIPSSEFWSYFKKNTGAVIGLLIIVGLLSLVAISPISSRPIRRSSPTMPPSSSRRSGRPAVRLHYPLGTDAIGRDILSRSIHGARLSLTRSASP